MGFSTIGGAGGGSAETPSGGAGSAEHAGVDDQSSSNDDQITIKDTEVVINEDGDDLDFRVEASGEANALVVQGSDGYVGIGLVNPNVDLHVNGANPVIAIGSTSGTDPRLDFYKQATTTISGTIFLDQSASTNGVLKILRSASGTATDGIAINDDGDVGIGTITPDSILEVSKAGADAEVLISAYHDTEATTPKITFRKADNTEASPALVDDDAVLGTIDFLGHDGVNFERGAKIEARVQGTSASNDLPTELTFWTTPDGSNAAAERMSIGADGAVALKTLAAAPSATADYAKIYAKDTEYTGAYKLVLHGEGADEATEIVDSSSSGHSLVAHGGAQIDTAQYKWGASSILLDGTDDYIEIPHSEDFNFGSANFTVHFWYRCPSQQGNVYLMVLNPTDAEKSYGQCTIDQSNDGSGVKLEAGSKSTDVWDWTGFTPELALNNWHHIAYVRNGAIGTLYANGVPVANTSALTGALTNDGNASTIGKRPHATPAYVAAHFDEIVVVKGTALWTADFSSDLPDVPSDSASAVLWAQDEQGNDTRISPHNAQGEWEYFSKNTKTGKTTRINMEEVVSDLGKLTGKNYIKDE